MKALTCVFWMGTCVMWLLALPALANEVKGKAMDILSQQLLSGVKIQIVGSDGKVIAGTVSKAKGEFLLQNIPAGEYTLTAKYIGYEDFSTKITVKNGETTIADMSLIQADISLEQLVVTASRKQEKALDAPAAISLVSAKTLERDAVLSPEQALRNVAGVDVITVGVNRQQVSVRGFNQPFFASAFAMVDFRQANVPALGVNAFQLMPISSLDLDHVEVVRGPSSALFGSGADVGVIQ